MTRGSRTRCRIKDPHSLNALATGSWTSLSAPALASIIAYRREICADNLKPRHLRYLINILVGISSGIRFGSPVFLSSDLMTHQNALRLDLSMGLSVTRETGRR